MDILERIVENIHQTHSIPKQKIWDHLNNNKIHKFENGILLERGNEVHLHFLTKNWFEVKRCITPALKDIFTRYDIIDTYTDIPNAAKALTLKLGCKQEGDRITLTKEDFENEFRS